MTHLFRFILILLMPVIIMSCGGAKIRLFTDASDPLKEFTLEGRGADKILLISVNGMISDASQKSLVRSKPSVVQQIVAQLKKAEKDKQIKAVLLKINSPGGTITASDILYHEISDFKARTKAKLIVSMMDIATSGAYYISLPADMIMAHPTTVTGSVGVIFLQPKVKGLMDKIGFGVEVKKTGRNKDMGSPFREGTQEEQQLFQNMADDFGRRFISLVQTHRKSDQSALAEISTARVFLADDALKLGLVDNIGYLSDAVTEAKKLAGLEDAKLVTYRRTEFPEDNVYNTADVESENPNTSAIHIEIPESLYPNAGFYYLWGAAVGD